MFRSLIASIIAFAIAVTVVVNPAYAESADTNSYFNNYGVINNIYGNGNSVTIDNPSKKDSYSEKQDSSNPFIDGVINMAGSLIGGAIVCYSIDGIATVFFPPAAVLASFCPAM